MIRRKMEKMNHKNGRKRKGREELTITLAENHDFIFIFLIEESHE